VPLQAGTLRFAPGEFSKTIKIPLVNDGYHKGPETFLIKLQNPVGTAIGTLGLPALKSIENASASPRLGLYGMRKLRRRSSRITPPFLLL